jgi:hypothetical protein
VTGELPADDANVVEGAVDCAGGGADAGDADDSVDDVDELAAIVVVVTTDSALTGTLLSDDSSLPQPAPINAQAISATTAVVPTRAMPTSRAEPPDGAHLITACVTDLPAVEPSLEIDETRTPSRCRRQRLKDPASDEVAMTRDAWQAHAEVARSHGRHQGDGLAGDRGAAALWSSI